MDKEVNQVVQSIAQVCHDANASYCRTIGDDSQPLWADAPSWQQLSAINGVESHLKALASGQEPSPSASHESWLAQKEEEGWKYGPVKDVEKKEHPCFVSYSELPLAQRLKDYIFGAIVKAFYDAEKSS